MVGLDTAKYCDATVVLEIKCRDLIFLVLGMSVAIILLFSHYHNTYQAPAAPITTPVDIDSLVQQLRTIAENEVKAQTASLVLLLEEQKAVLKDVLLSRKSEVQDEKEAKVLRDIVKAEIEIFDADGNNLTDFASSSIGAFISKPYTTQSYVPDLQDQLGGLPGLPTAAAAPLQIRVEEELKLPWVYLSAVIKWSYDKLRSVVRQDTSFSRGPSAVLEKDLSLGQCWAFKGSKGYVTIRLGGPVYIDSFTVDHVPRGKRITANSAPKNLTLWGLGKNLKQKRVWLGEGQYDINGPTRQTFPLQPSDTSTTPHTYVRFEIDSNHGNDRYTCVYRLRVHGKLSIKK